MTNYTTISAPEPGRAEREIPLAGGPATTCANRGHGSQRLTRPAMDSKAPRRRELVSLREFARRKGWRSHTYVLRLARQGVITLARGGRVDPVRAEAELAAIGHGVRLPAVTEANKRQREEAGRRRRSDSSQAPRSAPGPSSGSPPMTRAEVDALEYLINACKAQCLAAIDEMARQLRASTTRGAPR